MQALEDIVIPRFETIETDIGSTKTDVGSLKKEMAHLKSQMVTKTG